MPPKSSDIHSYFWFYYPESNRFVLALYELVYFFRFLVNRQRLGLKQVALAVDVLFYEVVHRCAYISALSELIIDRSPSCWCVADLLTRSAQVSKNFESLANASTYLFSVDVDIVSSCAFLNAAMSDDSTRAL